MRAQAGAARWFMDYRNADGSAAEMCGNGTRVFAAYLRREGLETADEFAIATRAGTKLVRFEPDGVIAVNLGPWRFADEANAGDDGIRRPRPPRRARALLRGEPRPRQPPHRRRPARERRPGQPRPRARAGGQPDPAPGHQRRVRPAPRARPHQHAGPRARRRRDALLRDRRLRGGAGHPVLGRRGRAGRVDGRRPRRAAARDARCPARRSSWPGPPRSSPTGRRACCSRPAVVPGSLPSPTPGRSGILRPTPSPRHCGVPDADLPSSYDHSAPPPCPGQRPGGRRGRRHRHARRWRGGRREGRATTAGPERSGRPPQGSRDARGRRCRLLGRPGRQPGRHRRAQEGRQRGRRGGRDRGSPRGHGALHLGHRRRGILRLVRRRQRPGVDHRRPRDSANVLQREHVP